MFLILSEENIFGNHVVAKKEEWHRCGTCQMDSDNKVNNDTIKVESKYNRLERIME